MKVLTLTYFTPYKENINGISALIYYLLKYRPNSIETIIYTYNRNRLTAEQILEASMEIGAEIVVVPDTSVPKKKTFLRRHFASWLRNETNFIEISDYIKEIICNYNADYIWLYQYYLYKIPYQLPKNKFIITGCDSNALFCKRCMKDPFIISTIKGKIHALLSYWYALETEKLLPIKNCKFHLVGQADVDFHHTVTGHTNSFYSPHPHYMVLNKQISWGTGKLKVLWAGANDLYMRTEGTMLLKVLITSNHLLSEKLDITFLGKGWDNHVESLKSVGYQVRYQTWVEDYISYIINFDIQLAPISIGTGTKGKILDAMANGLLVIGTKYAVENIDEKADGCIVYHDAREITSLLIEIYKNKTKYEKIAKNGRDIVRREHNPKECSRQFFSNFCSL